MRLCLVASCLLIAATESRAQNGAQNDTMLLWKLPETEVRSTQLWDNDTLAYRYNQLKHYVKTILPYLNAATVTINDVQAKLNSGIKGAERRRYIAAKDHALREQFEDRIKKLNITQGMLLVKLIARQTGANLYNIIRETKGGVTALKWQTWARLNGHNIAKRYDPADEPQLERIMRSLGYPLPAIYAQADEME